jgi:hypothetical protein
LYVKLNLLPLVPGDLESLHDRANA